MYFVFQLLYVFGFYYSLERLGVSHRSSSCGPSVASSWQIVCNSRHTWRASAPPSPFWSWSLLLILSLVSLMVVGEVSTQCCSSLLPSLITLCLLLIMSFLNLHQMVKSHHTGKILQTVTTEVRWLQYCLVGWFASHVLHLSVKHFYVLYIWNIQSNFLKMTTLIPIRRRPTTTFRLPLA